MVNLLLALVLSLSGVPTPEYVVKVSCSKGNEVDYGTGFFVNRGTIVTNAHVVELGGSVRVQLPTSGTMVPATVHGIDQSRDVAILTVDDGRWCSSPVRKGSHPAVGDHAWVFGFPRGQMFEVRGPAPVARKFFIGNGYASYELTGTETVRGMSGSPVVGKDGRCIGILWGHNSFLCVSELSKFLSERGVDWE